MLNSTALPHRDRVFGSDHVNALVCPLHGSNLSPNIAMPDPGSRLLQPEVIQVALHCKVGFALACTPQTSGAVPRTKNKAEVLYL